MSAAMAVHGLAHGVAPAGVCGAAAGGLVAATLSARRPGVGRRVEWMGGVTCPSRERDKKKRNIFFWLLFFDKHFFLKKATAFFLNMQAFAIYFQMDVHF